MLRAGVPENQAMKISGHKTRSMLDRYDIVSERDIADSVRKIENFHRVAAEKSKSEATVTVSVTGESAEAQFRDAKSN
jgi:predicted MarR family transcription regulator